MRALGIRPLLLMVSAASVLSPFLFLGLLKVYDLLLIRETEERLAHEAVLVGEVWRERLSEITGEGLGDPRPPYDSSPFTPYLPQISLGDPVVPLNPPDPGPFSPRPASPLSRAAERLSGLLERARPFNLSALRLIDGQGCVVASTNRDVGRCIPQMPEVARALTGVYASHARERPKGMPVGSWNDRLTRRGVQVVVAVPIFRNGAVLGVVHAARTSESGLQVLWKHRRLALVILVGSILLTGALSLMAARTIARPLRKLSQGAQRVAEGGPVDELHVSQWAPMEVQDLSGHLATMAKRLDARADYVARFAADATHELKSPITAIRGAAELLLDDAGAMGDDLRRRFLSNIDADASRMQQIVQNLLVLARVENQGREAGASVDLGVVFRDLGEVYPDVQFRVAEGARAFPMGETSLTSILRNLLENARMHGGPPIRVEAQPSGGRWELRVEDGGPGIPEASRGRIFDRFFTTARDRGGTGLGLAIVRAMVEVHGGTIEVESESGRTAFVVRLGARSGLLSPAMGTK